jgi:CubicO group peptidase (beta-lactamase class C family)
MKKQLLTVTALLFSSLIPAAFAQSLDTSQIDTFMTQQMQRYSVPGMGLALVKDGKIVYTKGYGVRDTKTNTPVNADTLFAIGSVTKSFTSLGIMQLVTAGKIKLDAPVQTYLPNLKFSNATIGAKVTVRQLLSMSSGLDRFDTWAFNPNINTRPKLLETIAQIPFSSTPGKVFAYNNQNYVAAAAILETLTKQSWEEYTKTNILIPIGMNRTRLGFIEAQQDGNFAQGHSAGLQGVQATPAFDRFPIIAPAGSIHSSVNEMAKYLIAQMGQGENRVPRLQTKEMHKTQIAIGNPFSGGIAGMTASGYGLGWFTEEYRGVKIIEHGGNINGFTSSVQMLPQKSWGMVLLTNANNANAFINSTRLALTEELLKMKPRSDFSQAPALATQAMIQNAKNFVAKPETLKQLEGTYALITGESIKLALENNQLILTQQGQNFRLIPASDTQYIIDFDGFILILEFQISPNGFIWIIQDEQVVGVKIPTTSVSSQPTTTTLTDSKNRFSTVLPDGLQIVQTTPQFTVVQSDKPEAAFLFNVSEAKATLEETAVGFIKQLEPSFNLKPIQTTNLPAINGIVWTQIIYELPDNQTLVVFATQKGNSVYIIAVQADTNDFAALTPALNQILLNYKIN